MKWAVLIEIDEGETAYVTGKNPFKTGDSPKLFNSFEKAQVEAKKWNTGAVVEYR